MNKCYETKKLSESLNDIENRENDAGSRFFITVDGNDLTEDTLRLGMVSANGSSRLLMDYKAKHYDAYHEIIDCLFNRETGIGLSHIKIEMGSDVDSSSGAEPATKRYAQEPADVTRGAGFMFAADVKRLYPYVTVDLLQWGEPAWAHESFENRYRWYKETLDAAFDTYALKFDCVSACPNESGFLNEDYNKNIKWIKYFSRALKSEKGGRYDYSQIKIIAADEIGQFKLSYSMLEDEELRDAVDILGIHYSTWSNDAAKKLKDRYKKEIWYSEGAAVMLDPFLNKNANIISNVSFPDKKGEGISGTNGALEIAARILNMYPQGHMTMYEFQPAVSSYYSGSAYTPKQLITADTPWSGYYSVEVGAAIANHFTRFLTNDMRYVKNACFGDGDKNNETGDGHGLVNTTNNYITLADKKTGDFTMIFVNDSDISRSYNIFVKNLKKADGALSVWTTRGCEPVNWLAKTGEIFLNDGKCFVKVEPYSVVTITTLKGQKSFLDCKTSDFQHKKLKYDIPLPYYENYDYSDDFLSSRGGAPLYHTDICGAFEVSGGRLVQKVTYDDRPYGWGAQQNVRWDVDPCTQVGGENWADYAVSSEVYFDENAPETLKNYVGIGLRYSGTQSKGYSIRLFSDGIWQAVKNTFVICEGTIDGFTPQAKHCLKVEAIGNKISYYADGTLLHTFEDNCGYTSGRAAIFSAFANNSFKNLAADEVSGLIGYVKKIDALSDEISYSGSWELRSGESYNYRNRTRAVSGSSGDSLEFSFSGIGVNIVSGIGNEACVKVEIDGNTVCERVQISKTDIHQTSLALSGFSAGSHTFKITVLSGRLTVDTFEIIP